ncbi:LRR receptor-like serine/threonine-protein kinase [Thalictrum thalictroides]|uniref:LRR receptor-like serine/threonine-protein kinase n=1 Tax=Thalictrum thalictroides TaxID=46969 RepID=A0A7J6VIE7_THATH|nr:LRR receptor-like serine/threonine-protein kinase [Thalictrum thalictroides]
MSSLFALSYLNLSHNNLSGTIPSGNQLQTLDDPSIYEGNSGLCGYPLPKTCTGYKPLQVDKPPQVPASDNKGSGFISIWFYTGMASGYVVGFWGACGVLLFKKTWRYAYFRFADDIKDMLFVAIMTRINRLKRT